MDCCVYWVLDFLTSRLCSNRGTKVAKQVVLPLGNSVVIVIVLLVGARPALYTLKTTVQLLHLFFPPPFFSAQTTGQ